MIKLIASDLDGTILQNGAQSISPEMIDVINQLGKKGIHFVAASGRSYKNIQLLFKDVTVPMFIISENGGMYSFQDQLHIPKRHTRETLEYLISAMAQDPDCELTYACENTTYVNSKGSIFSRHLEDEVHYDITQVDDFLTLEILPIKLAIFNSKGTQDSIGKYKDLLSDKVNVMTSGNEWIDFMPYGVNKGIALEHIADALHIAPEECAAFGDQWNDAEMLQFAGTSYAMKNAAEGISNFCTHTTDSVLNELKKFL